MSITRAKGVSLEEVSNQYTSRSFHLGNLTSRDLVPIVAGCEGETFDLNTLSDRAYFPDKIVFQGKITDILLDKRTNYVATSTMKEVPFVSSDSSIQEVVDQAFSETITLGGFRNHINQQLGIGDFTTFSQKIVAQKDMCIKALTKITNSVDNEMLQHIRGRYVTNTGDILTLQKIHRDLLIYKSADTRKTVTINKNDLADTCMKFFTNRARLSQKTTESYTDIMQECQGPIFCNEINTIITYIIEASKNNKGSVFHVGGQAQYSYINNGSFSNNFKDLLAILDEDHDITNGIKYEGLEIVPAHFFRFAGYKEDLLETLHGVFTSFDTLDSINAQRSALFRTGHTLESAEVQELRLKTGQITTMQKQLFDTLLIHPEIQQMPIQTLKQGTLNELYQSQLDMYYNMKQGFKPEKQWEFITKISLDKIELIMKKIISHHAQKA